MVTAKVKGIHSTEIEDLETYVPEKPDSFCVSLRILVGPKESEGEESFDVLACTPRWLAELCEKQGFVVGRHYLIVNGYDSGLISKAITKLVERWSGGSWREVAEKVGRIGYWEFEDYQT